MYVALFLMAGVPFWVGATLIIDGYLRRDRRPDLAERLRPLQPSIADEARDWLDRRDQASSS
jgi:hypothetical protein